MVVGIGRLLPSCGSGPSSWRVTHARDGLEPADPCPLCTSWGGGHREVGDRAREGPFEGRAFSWDRWFRAGKRDIGICENVRGSEPTAAAPSLVHPPQGASMPRLRSPLLGPHDLLVAARRADD